ncbi:hypothetical protein ACKXF7_05990 [Faecalibacterium sp. 7]|uniref:hypothetical protein n=1 Tax=Faecalibacterium sp. 7 TaxID=3402017 RepID=UPI003C2CA595
MRLSGQSSAAYRLRRENGPLAGSLFADRRAKCARTAHGGNPYGKYRRAVRRRYRL